MKNRTLYAAVMVLVLACVSCKKTRTCECTTTTTGTSQGFSLNFPSKSDSKAYSKKMTKKQAEAACDHMAESIESTEEDTWAKNPDPDVTFSVKTKCTLD
jgi:hypothetical protein